MFDIALNSNSIDFYIKKVNAIPFLTHAEEIELATRLKLYDDLNAASRLIESHLKLVVSMSRDFIGYGLPREDLIQEGNIGLMKAVRKFDIEKGFRLSTLAIDYIRFQIYEYVLKNWKSVKCFTTKAQRILFFNLRRYKQDLSNSIALSETEILKIQTDYKQISRNDILEVNKQLYEPDLYIDHQISREDDNSYIFDIEDHRMCQDSIQENKSMALLLNKIRDNLELLDERSKSIIKARWYEEMPKTLSDLSKIHGVSIERIRQIEVAAFKKIKKDLS